MVDQGLQEQTDRIRAALAKSGADELLSEFANRALTRALRVTNGVPAAEKAQEIALSSYDTTALLVQFIASLPDIVKKAMDQHVVSCPWNAGQEIGATHPKMKIIKGWVEAVRPALWPVSLVVTAVVLKGQLAVLLEFVKGLA